jgi:hypothetical protein
LADNNFQIYLGTKGSTPGYGITAYDMLADKNRDTQAACAYCDGKNCYSMMAMWKMPRGPMTYSNQTFSSSFSTAVFNMIKTSRTHYKLPDVTYS